MTDNCNLGAFRDELKTYCNRNYPEFIRLTVAKLHNNKVKGPHFLHQPTHKPLTYNLSCLQDMLGKSGTEIVEIANQ